MAEQGSPPVKTKESKTMRAITLISKVLCFISATALGVMMFVSIADVIGRGFMHPIKGIFEMVGLLMVIAGSLGLGYCQLVKGNIMINLVTSRLKPRWQAVIFSVSLFASIAVCILVCWQVGARMMENTSNGPAGLTIDLRWPVWPFMLLMVIGFAWATVVFFTDFLNSVKGVFKK
ncbi:MAG: TRAP transporter small permease [Dehalococcoidales bacterium]|nr:TRAP transporter small permease [Dehalococcoidales bacterium]